MSHAIFPLVFQSEEVRLLTALALGFLFGFSLERAGFGNARKLAAQFYLYDMTVFKVMFTAILVAMVGLYVLVGFGLVDLTAMWINPTFMWAQVIGGFVLGVGFIMSGLCPGTSVVSTASGRIDGVVALGGIFIGTLAFAFLIDLLPAVQVLYEGGSMGVSLLPELMGVPAPWFVLGVVVMAGAAFIGAEKVEKIVQAKYGFETIEPAPRVTRSTPRLKFALAGSLALVMVAAAAVPIADRTLEPVQMTAVTPLDLAASMIAKDPTLVILDMRELADVKPDESIPGACRCGMNPEQAAERLGREPAGTRVVVFDETGSVTEAPGFWPVGLEYSYLEGGLAGWEAEVLTPVTASTYDLAERARVERQNQISAYFTGAAVQTSSVSAPAPVVPAGGAKKKKKAGGC